MEPRTTMRLFLLLVLLLLPSLAESSTDSEPLPLELAASAPACLPHRYSLASFSQLFPECQDLQAASVTLSGDRLLTSHRVCLLEGPVRLHLRLHCHGFRVTRTLLLSHPHLEEPEEEEDGSGQSRPKRSSDAISFAQSSFALVVEEEEPGALIATLEAVNPDGLPLFYSLDSPADPRSEKFFRLDRRSGELRTSGPLDRELMGEHRLRVTARENGNPGRSAVAEVRVSVRDVNDHVPVFEKKTFIGSISEAAEVGTTVLHVHAHDDDADELGRVRYSFVEDSTLFSIDPLTGIVQVSAQLDREAEDFFRLSVRATDGGGRSSTALVEISLLDANDNHPSFEQSSYTAELPENMDPKLRPVVARIRASDADAGANGRVRYSIVSGNVGDAFAVDYETGDLRLLKRLSYKASPVYQLVIRAQDGGAVLLSNTTVVQVHVADVNDNPPTFYTAAYTETVMENVPEHSLVTVVQAYDPDDGRNAFLTYRFRDAPPNLPFLIEPASGRVLTKEPLDREAQSLFRLTVEAVDSGTPPLNASVPLTITVADVDDNRPVFQRKSFNVSLREDTERGTEVARLKAVDADEGSVLQYSVSGGDEEGTFIVLREGEEGVLRLNGRLDFAAKALFTLSVRALDRSGKSDTATVWVYVEDVNSAPAFLEQPLRLAVAESESPGATVAVVEASDKDQGPNANLTYSLDGDHGDFDIQPEKGVITVARPLDRETRPNYNLKVRVQDAGEPPLSASTTLEIVLEDVNDNAPVFGSDNYSVEVGEDAAVGTSFLQVSASDADAGSNGALFFSFADDQSNASFSIDPTSGIVRIAEALDREAQASFRLRLVATDRGSPALSGSATLHVSLLDRNDNPPRFQLERYVLTVGEEAGLGSVVGRVVAEDADEGANAEVVYAIAGGPHASLFALRRPRSGPGVHLLTNTALDYEGPTNVYRLRLSAASGDLSSSVPVEVRVLDRNDNAPQLKDFGLVFNNYQGHFPLERLGRIPAFDPDQNDTLVFSLPEGNEAGLLELNAATGHIRLSPALNTNRHLRHDITACVTDGANSVCALCRLEVVMVTAEMLAASVTVVGRGRSAADLLSPVPFAQLRQAIATLVPSRPEDVLIFSVAEAAEAADPAQPLLNISFAIKDPHTGGFVPASLVRELAEVWRWGLGRVAGLEVLAQEDSYCVGEPCPGYQRCEALLRFAAATEFRRTDDFLFRAVEPRRTFACRCPLGYATLAGGAECGAALDLCYSSPCGHNATCRPSEASFRCLCPQGRTGEYVPLSWVVFEPDNYSVEVGEDAAVGTSFLQVSASDADAGSNGALFYSFADDQSNASFSIDPTSGIVRIAEALDREAQASFRLRLVATDRGSPALSGSATLHVSLLDRNDNPPRFQLERYVLTVGEEAGLGSVVGRVVAEDADEGANAEVVYAIAGGPHASLFALRRPRSGPGVHLLTNTALDYEGPTNVYRLRLSAASGDLSSSVPVEVRVLDRNDNAPQLKDFGLVFNNYQGHFPLERLGRIPAFDPDQNDTLVFSLPEGNEAGLLELNAATGHIRLSPALNTNRHLRHDITACVTDGANSVCALCRLEVVMVTAEMLAASVTVVGRGRSAADLLSPVPFAQLRQAIATLVPSRPEDVLIFSVAEAAEAADPAQPLLNISFAIKDPHTGGFVPASLVRELAEVWRWGLGRVAGLEVLAQEDSYCVGEPCPGYQRCEALLRFAAATEFRRTDDFLFRAVEPRRTFACRCPLGYATLAGGAECGAALDLCYSSPCGHNATCRPSEASFRCLCPQGRTGDRCELPALGRVRSCPWPSADATASCELRGRSFGRGHWLSLPPITQRHTFTLSLDLATVEPDGLLLYNGRFQAAHDFLALYLKGGVPTVRLSLGGPLAVTLALPDAPSNRLNDGRWHKLSVELDERRLRLWLDGCPKDLVLGFGEELGLEPCAAETTVPECRNADCFRFLDLSGPLYLGALPPGKESRLEEGEPTTLDGCLRDLTLEGRLVDLGTEAVQRQRGGSQPGCGRKGDFCEAQPCKESLSCESLWNGRRCTCRKGWAGSDCSLRAHSAAYRLRSSDSYVEWNATSLRPFRLPLSLSLVARTRQTNALLLTAVLTASKREASLQMELKEGRLIVRMEDYSWPLASYSLADGQWHEVEVRLREESVEVSVDGGSATRESLWSPPKGLGSGRLRLSSAFVGSLPGAEQPSPFLGCVRDAKAEDGGGRGGFLTVQSHYGTKRDCERPPNGCESDPCPPSGLCVEDWDRHRCRCLPGHFGKDCKPACHLDGLCKNGGRCEQSRSLGYRCHCAKGWTGAHCEKAVAKSGWACPSGWWGQPLCGPCRCPLHKGFAADCHKLTGECRCLPNHFRPAGSDRCLPCDCHFPLGAALKACDSLSGQCSCRGDVVGRRCDRCESPRAEISRKSGTCEVVHGACPAALVDEVAWPRGVLGRVQKRPCPGGALGKATRKCHLSGLWSSPSLSNCSSRAFQDLRSFLDKLDSGGAELDSFSARRTAAALSNATQGGPLFPADLYTAYRLDLALLRAETGQSSPSQLLHLQDKGFVGELVGGLSGLLDAGNAEGWAGLSGDGRSAAVLLGQLELYGDALTDLHHTARLPPFLVARPNVFLAVDHLHPSLHQQQVLPKFDRFVQPEGDDYPQMYQIRLPRTKAQRTAFYAVFRELGGLMRSSPLVPVSPVLSLSIRSEDGKLLEDLESPVRLTLPYDLEARYWGPRCARWDAGAGAWSEAECRTWTRNESHVECDCVHLSSFAVVAEEAGEAGPGLLQAGLISLLRPGLRVAGLTGLGLLILLLLWLLRREGWSGRRRLQLCLALSSFLISLCLLLVSAAATSPVACLAVHGLLDFASVALFGWLASLCVETWRSVTEVDSGRFWPYLIPGLLLPSTAAALALLLPSPPTLPPQTCWFSLQDPFVWLLLVPIGLCLLLSLYALLMCVLIAFSREWDLVFTKINLRSGLVWLSLVVLVAVLWWSSCLVSLGQPGWAGVELGSLVLGLVFPLVLLVWVLLGDRRGGPSPDLKTAVNLWLSEDEGNRMTASLHETSQHPQGLGRAESPRASSPLLPAPLPVDDADAEDEASDSLSHSYHQRPTPTLRCYGETRLPPDVVPAWDERLHLPATSPSQSSSTGSQGHYRPLHPRHFPPRGDQHSTPSDKGGILSPVQAVLYGSGDYAEPPVQSGYSTFSPRRTARTALLPRSQDDLATRHEPSHL